MVFGDLSALFKLEQKKSSVTIEYYLYDSRHTKGEPWNCIIKAAASTYVLVLKTIASALPRPPPL